MRPPRYNRLMGWNRLVGGPSRGRNDHCRQATFGRQFLEGAEIAALQIFPARDEFPALPFQLLKLQLLSFGGRGVGSADVHGQVGQLGVELRWIRQRVLIRTDREIDEILAHGYKFLLEIIRG